MAFLPGEAVGLGTVHRVRGGYGAWVAGCQHADAAWEGSGWYTAFRNHSPRWGATYLQDGLPDLQGTAELPHWGGSGIGVDEDGGVGSFLPLECPGYCHHFGGVKPPPPTVHLM